MLPPGSTVSTSTNTRDLPESNLVGSPLKYHYDRGQLLQSAKEGLSMSTAAQTGENVTQAQRFDKFRKAAGYKNSINKIFFDDIG